MICYSKCWSCMFNEHAKGWHTWADGDDVAHALSIGRPDPSDQRCGCYCQREAVKPEPPKRSLIHKGGRPRA
jgi:hypothetical protein